MYYKTYCSTPTQVYLLSLLWVFFKSTQILSSKENNPYNFADHQNPNPGVCVCGGVIIFKILMAIIKKSL